MECFSPCPAAACRRSLPCHAAASVRPGKRNGAAVCDDCGDWEAKHNIIFRFLSCERPQSPHNHACHPQGRNEVEQAACRLDRHDRLHSGREHAASMLRPEGEASFCCRICSGGSSSPATAGAEGVFRRTVGASAETVRFPCFDAACRRSLPCHAAASVRPGKRSGAAVCDDCGDVGGEAIFNASTKGRSLLLLPHLFRRQQFPRRSGGGGGAHGERLELQRKRFASPALMLLAVAVCRAMQRPVYGLASAVVRQSAAMTAMWEAERSANFIKG